MWCTPETRVCDSVTVEWCGRSDLETILSKKTAAKKPAKTRKTASKSAAKAPASRRKAKKPVTAKAKRPTKAKTAKSTSKVSKKPAVSKAAAKKAAPKKAAAKKAARKTAPAKANAKAPTPPKPVRIKIKKRKPVVLPAGYEPSEDEPFMNDKQTQYFYEKLVNWKDEIIRETKETLVGLTEDSIQHADLADRATSETDRAYELRARDRQRKLIAKIDAALNRIEDGSYGYCEETGEPIGLKRLEARPIATLSLEAQERHERRERVYRED